MNRYPKISVVTPSFNQGRFIEDCIKSVLDQNYPNFEHIIVDNCSTDGTLEVLKKYPHLKWIFETDKGQSDAINKGFRRSTGDIVAWLNSDDFYCENVFWKIVEIFLKNPQVFWIYGNSYFVDEKGKKITYKRALPFNIFILTAAPKISVPVREIPRISCIIINGQYVRRCTQCYLWGAIQIT